MKELIRTKQGSFLLEDAFTLEDIQKDNYKLLSIKEALPNIKITKIDDKILKQVKNGMVLDKFFEEESLQLADKGDKAYAVAFAAKGTASDMIINGIVSNKHYKNIAINKEVIFLAVNVWMI